MSMRARIKTINLFEDLPPDAWRTECPTLIVADFQDKGVIYRQGEPCGGTFLIAEGHIMLSRLNAEGNELTMAILTKGELFGPALPQNEAEAQETATAKGAAKLYRIPMAEFKGLLARRASLAWAVLCAFSSRQRLLERKLECFLFKDVRGRVAETLLELAGHYGVNCKHGFEIDIHLTQQELADLVGADRSVVSTVMNEFRDQGILFYDRDCICINQIKALEHFLAS